MRTLRAGQTLVSILHDYWTVLRATSTKHSPAQDGSSSNRNSSSSSIVWSNVHQRSANRLLDLFLANGGVYIKLGQHLSALVYLLPQEYTETMKVLQDQCGTSSWEDIEKLLEIELVEAGHGCAAKVFESIDRVPIGVASLAQVHRATLRDGITLSAMDSASLSCNCSTTELDPSLSNGCGHSHCVMVARPAIAPQVVVKIQHPSVGTFADVDLVSARSVHRSVEKLEAGNSRRVKEMFQESKLITAPKVVWATRRLLVMEYIDGAKIDDQEYMRKHGINCETVVQDLSRAFVQMIFYHGFVHCDPHPGNVFIRACDDRRPWYRRIYLGKPRNFEIILYQTTRIQTHDTRGEMDSGRTKTSSRTSGTDNSGTVPHTIQYYRLFASMVCGRPWDSITSSSGTPATLDLDRGRVRSNNGGMESDVAISDDNVVHLHVVNGDHKNLGTDIKDASADNGGQVFRGLLLAKSDAAKRRVHRNAKSTQFLVAMADILGQLPQELLLVLKTQDILRSIDERLGIAHGLRHNVRMIDIIGQCCAEVIRYDGVDSLRHAHSRDSFPIIIGVKLIWPIWMFKDYWTYWLSYYGTISRLALIRIIVYWL
ncbi:hypothetical protein BSLG_003412 [Batrachochytrium salamandrivorans]|nr:hypothetical protein BSLG_003412 [Batrachochytrium salamandrivorans]